MVELIGWEGGDEDDGVGIRTRRRWMEEGRGKPLLVWLVSKEDEKRDWFAEGKEVDVWRRRLEGDCSRGETVDEEGLRLLWIRSLEKQLPSARKSSCYWQLWSQPP